MHSPPPPPQPTAAVAVGATTKVDTAVGVSSAIKFAAQMQHGSDVSDCFDSGSQSNVTMRVKRKGEGELHAFRTEVDSMFKELMREQQNFFSNLNAKMEEIKTQNQSLQQAVEFNSAMYDNFLKRMEILEQEKKEDRKQILVLEGKVEQLERQLRTSSLEIRNIPRKLNETKQDLVETVMQLGKVIDVSIQPTEIKDVFRINSKTEHKTILADFTSVLTKEKIIQSVKLFNKTNKVAKLNTQQLHIDGPKLPIFVSENLTPKTKRLFFLARDYATHQGFKYCWSSVGKVFLRKEDGSPIICISSEADIASLNMKQ